MFKSLFCLTLACLAGPAFAISIASVKVSETPDSNGYFSVTISGTGFGNGPTIAIFDDFNSQKSDAPIVLDKSALIGKWNKSSSYKAVPNIVDYNNSKAFQVYAGRTIGGASIAQIETVFTPKVSNIFVSYSVVVPEGKYFAGSTEDFTFPNASSWKFTWITDTSDGIGSRTLYNVCTPTHSGGGSFMIAGNSVNYGWLNVGKSWSWHTKNYISYATLPDPTLPQQKEGTILFELTGKANAALIFKKTNALLFTPSNSTSFDRIKFPGWFGNGDTTNFDAYYDDIYVATGENALARVEISNAVNVANSTINLTMPINSWNDTKIEMLVHKEHIINGESTNFIRVHDKLDATATAPLRCNKCPKPPSVI